jgi:hypothetical protein
MSFGNGKVVKLCPLLTRLSHDGFVTRINSQSQINKMAARTHLTSASFLFLRTIHGPFCVKGELFYLVQLYSSAKGPGFVTIVNKFGGFQKCSWIVTDDAKCTNKL